MPIISIIIPVYNVEAYVEVCLRSVMEQEHPGFGVECIIVDDRGQDNSMDVVRRTLDSYNGDIEFKIIEHDKNRGLSAARNTAIRGARGEYLTFLDSDDRLLPGALAGMYKLTVNYPGVDIVQGEVQLDKPEKGLEQYLGVSSVSLPEYISEKNIAKRVILFEMPVTSWAKFIRREFIIHNDLYFVEGMIHEDDMWDVCCSQYINSIAFYFTPVYYYNNDMPHSIMGNTDKTRSFVARMLIIQKAAECYIQNPCRTYYNYLNSQLNISTKIDIWNKIKDKSLAKKSITQMRSFIGRTNCRPIQIAAWYYSLPLSLSRNSFIIRVYNHAFSRYRNMFSRKLTCE